MSVGGNGDDLTRSVLIRAVLQQCFSSASVVFGGEGRFSEDLAVRSWKGRGGKKTSTRVELLPRRRR